MKIKCLSVFFSLFCGLFISSCSEGYKHYEGIYMRSATGNNPLVSVVVDESFPKELDLLIASTALLDNDVTVELQANPAAIATYNKKFGTLYRALPENCYELSDSKALIKKGDYANASPIKLRIISSDGMEDGQKYMIPVSIKSAGDSHSIIESESTVYVAINQIIVGNALRLVGSQYVYTDFSKPAEGVVLPYDVSSLSKVSMEARVFIEKKDSYSLNTIFGLEENFVVRVTSESGKKGELEVTGGGMNNVATPTAFPMNAWTHLAVVYDGDESGKGKLTIYVNGEQSASMDVERKAAGYQTINLHTQYMQASDHSEGGGAKWIKNAPFWIGKSERARYLHGSISEAKIWAKALSAAEVKANVCITDPSADMLIAYWRFNVQENSSFKDLTGHGFDMRTTGSFNWTENVKCPEKY